MRQEQILTTPALHALLSGILDYAGLYPPAALGLEEAVHLYARYRQGPHAWMLSRFVLGVGRLEELTPYAALFEEDPPFRFAVLGSGGADPLPAFQADLRAVEAFQARHSRRAVVDVMEMRLPQGIADAEAMRAFLERARAALLASPVASLDLFFEVPMDAQLERTAPWAIEALRAWRMQHPKGDALQVGLKMRLGGTEAKAFPPAAHVAYLIARCRDAGVPLKATAGLHHPVRHHDASLQCPMHGFLNVFGAAVLASVHDLSKDRIQEILLDEDPAHFRFTPEAFTWNDLRATPEEIRKARTHLARGFGSCSFEEPLDDLRRLGLLD